MWFSRLFEIVHAEAPTAEIVHARGPDDVPPAIQGALNG